ncbi:MAG: hypothetical protein J6K14_10360 [Clostridia bacterium]|nr:hypothetical protein [Clostridia bacterium]
MEENTMITETNEAESAAEKKFCTSCGASIHKEAVMCPACGAAQDPQIQEKKESKGFKMNKKRWAVCGGIAAVVIALAFIIFYPSKFERVKDECVNIAGMVSSNGDDSFTIDTKPFTNNDYLNTSLVQQKALSAIRYANEELGFSDSVYSDMMQTNALMGRQSEENDKYTVSWTYHPSEGLEVTYTKK